jgi:predicted Zn-dependent peptidase
MNKIFIKKEGNTTIVIVATPNGAYTEPQYYKGISHFVEHMCFKGNPKRNQKQISSAIDNIGGVLNAFTDWEITAYWAKVGNTYKDLAIDVITDLVTKPLFPKKEVDKEREVIIQELKMYEDDAKYYVYDVFNSQFYNPDSGFHTSIIGTKETLKRITQKQLKDYHSTYKPILIVVGDVPNKVEIGNDYFERYEFPKVNDNREDIYVTRKNLTQANIILGNYTYLGDYNWLEQSAGLTLLESIYSDMSGRLFDTIREKYNMVYRIGFDWTRYNKAIQWTVSAGLDKEKIITARRLIVRELSRPLTKKELDIAYKKAVGTFEMKLDNITNIGNTVAYLATKGLDFNEYIYNYKKNLFNAKKFVNDMIDQINFESNLLAGVVPE